MCDKWSQLSIVINVVVTVTSIVVVAIAIAAAALAGFVDVSTATICPAAASAAADAALWHLLSPGTEQQLIHLGSVPSRLCRQRARCGELKSASAR